MNVPTLEEQIIDAKDCLERIREEFKDQPELLAAYEPSAIYLVNVLQGIESTELHSP